MHATARLLQNMSERLVEPRGQIITFPRQVVPARKLIADSQ